MASSITVDFGKAASAPTRIIFAVVDFTAITSYATGGHEDTVLSAYIAAQGLGTTYQSIPQAHYDGSEARYFKVNNANNKIVAYDDVGLATETTATDDMSGHTAIPIILIGY
jgi:hypothetical protein